MLKQLKQQWRDSFQGSCSIAKVPEPIVTGPKDTHIKTKRIQTLNHGNDTITGVLAVCMQCNSSLEDTPESIRTPGHYYVCFVPQHAHDLLALLYVAGPFPYLGGFVRLGR